MKITRRNWLAIGMGVIGPSLIIFGVSYNLSHIDDALDPGHYSPIIGATTLLGLALIILIPAVLRRYFWSLVLLGLAAVLWLWLWTNSR
jgi:hypothetical protein